VEALGVVVRWLHAASAVTLVGAFASLLLVARPAARAAGDAGLERFPDLDRRIMTLARIALAVTLVAGGLDLWRQVGVATGAGLLESLDPGRIASVLADTRYGTVWLARTGLLFLLAAFLLLADENGESDWLALRIEALGLSATALILGALAGHAAASEVSAVAMSLDALHLLATGVWGGGLLPLALCLAWARRLPSSAAAARANASSAARRSPSPSRARLRLNHVVLLSGTRSVARSRALAARA